MNTSGSVFIAHASEDKPRVRALRDGLVLNGFSVWFDESDLLPGDDWDARIRESIDCCKAFIACLSDRSLTKDGYFHREIRAALNRMEEKPPGTVFFIPALLEPVDVPDIRVGTVSINAYQYARLYEPDGFQLLCVALKRAACHEIVSVDSIRLPTDLAHQMPACRLILADDQMSGDRVSLELDLLKETSASFEPEWRDGRLAAVEGNLLTTYGNTYSIRLELPADYPAVPPRIMFAPGCDVPNAPHRYSDGSICVINLNQWSSSLSLAFMVAKASIWLNKCDVWKINGYWPGEKV